MHLANDALVNVSVSRKPRKLDNSSECSECKWYPHCSRASPTSFPFFYTSSFRARTVLIWSYLKHEVVNYWTYRRNFNSSTFGLAVAPQSGQKCKDRTNYRRIMSPPRYKFTELAVMDASFLYIDIFLYFLLKFNLKHNCTLWLYLLDNRS